MRYLVDCPERLPGTRPACLAVLTPAEYAAVEVNERRVRAAVDRIRRTARAAGLWWPRRAW